jgi:hypothetical protein
MFVVVFIRYKVFDFGCFRYRIIFQRIARSPALYYRALRGTRSRTHNKDGADKSRLALAFNVPI